ncbi:MAG: 50S ribosomal protein L22 [Nanoarchaeota archaeon]
MTEYGYGYKAGQNEAKAVGVGLPISYKHGSEVARFIRGMKVSRAKTVLDNVMRFKEAVPYTRYFEEIAHQKNVGPGRFPIKTCKNILAILESAEANAQFKGLNTGNLIIKHIAAQGGGKVHHYGRNGRKAKRAHIEIVLAESAQTAKPTKKEGSKAAPKK